MAKKYRSRGALVGALFAGVTLGGLSLWAMRRRSARSGSTTDLAGCDSDRDSWLPEDVLDLPRAPSVFQLDNARDESNPDDASLAEIFDRPLRYP